MIYSLYPHKSGKFVKREKLYYVGCTVLLLLFELLNFHTTLRGVVDLFRNIRP